jgi:hypothetical protein
MTMSPEILASMTWQMTSLFVMRTTMRYLDVAYLFCEGRTRGRPRRA